jgi:uncharacterized membrane protein
MRALASGISFRLVAILFLVVGMCLLLPQEAAADPIFQIIGLGGQNSQAYGINNFGAVVGAYGPAAGVGASSDAFVWQGGTLTTLPFYFNPAEAKSSAAFSISDSGYIAGYTGAGGRYHGAIWYKGQLVHHDILSGDFSELTDINNSGVSVGSAYYVGGDFLSLACFSVGTDCTNPAPLPGFGTTLLSLNNSGEMVGASFVYPIGAPAAISYKNGTVTTLFPNAGSTPSVAIAVNNSGSIAGSYDGNAFLLDGGRFIDLGFTVPVDTGRSITFDGNPLAINDWGEVVGGQYIWYGGQLYNVNDLLSANSGWTITEVNGVNDWGQIVGTGIYDGQTEAFIANPVPEPGSITLLVAGLATSLFLLRKQVVT